jgi:hypothetical protein
MSDKPEKKTRAKKSGGQGENPPKPKAKKAKEPEAYDDEEVEFLEMLNDKLAVYVKAELDALDPKGFDRAWEKLSKDLKAATELLLAPEPVEQKQVAKS